MKLPFRPLGPSRPLPILVIVAMSGALGCGSSVSAGGEVGTSGGHDAGSGSSVPHDASSDGRGPADAGTLAPDSGMIAMGGPDANAEASTVEAGSVEAGEVDSGDVDSGDVLMGQDADIVCTSGQPNEVITMVSGNGEALLPQWPTLDPLIVRVTSGGAPVACESVVWTTSDNAHTVANVTMTPTDANGLAQVQLVGNGIDTEESITPGTATATIPGGSVTFLTTTTYTDNTTGPRTALAAVTNPPNNVICANEDGGANVCNPTANGLLPGAIQIVVSATTGTSEGEGIPNVGLRLTDANDISMPAPNGIACVGGTVLTDSTGRGSCDLVLGPTPGTYGFGIAVGGFVTFPYVSVTIAP